MGGSLLLCPVLCLLYLLFPFSAYSSPLYPLCNAEEASALLQFKNSFTLNSSASEECVDFQSSYPKTESWENGTDCCMWDGVTCNTLSGHVIGLDLSCSWLYGELHSNNSLFQLTHLQTLDLSYNFFNRSQIPSKFGGLVSLTHLNLSSSAFSGEIPYEISFLSKLVSLDLSDNRFLPLDKGLKLEPSIWGSFILNVTDLRDLLLDGVNMSLIRPTYLSPLMNLSSSLVSLSLEDTELQGTLPNSILQLPNLQHLSLSQNQNLNIQIPESNWSTPLKYLGLSAIDFSRQSPNSIGSLKSLHILSLSSCGFQGPIPQSFWNLTQLTHLNLGENNFSGEIPLSLSNLQHLTYLDLSYNNFGGQIPNVFGKVAQLEYLFLSQNNFGGQLPFSLFSLTHIRYLICSSNKFEGPIPQNISGFSNLFQLDLEKNMINGAIPSWCFSLPSLKALFLSNNKFTGQVDEFSVYALKIVRLSNNMLQNSIPKSMFNLLNLTELLLSSNNFTGVLDFRKISKLHQLRFLDLSGNNFHLLNFDDSVNHTFPYLLSLRLSFCNISSIPKFIGRIPLLGSLDLSNNKIHGRVPDWLIDMGNNSLYSLDLSHNFLSSVEYLSKSRFKFLDLSFNLLKGDLPIPLHGVAFFSLSNNELTGHISSLICNASSLNILNLSHNKLTGLIPQCLGALPNLSVLDLQMNNLSGTILRNISEKNVLQTLHLNGNQLKGPLPRSLTHCKQLEVLDLGNNKIEDTFPNWLEPLEELQVLVLRANQFHGVIARLKFKHPFPKLRIFDVSNNHFNGPLPATYIKEFKGMMGIDYGRIGLQYMTNENYSSYHDSVSITMKGLSMELTRILVTFTTIDLSNNKFEGEIPNAIRDLNSLKGLNLSHNRIIGTIPPSLGDLKSLEWLDLSSNMLVGEIPKSLANLNFLSFLNLSQNQLVGLIPQGKQFNTFSNDSYEGNPGLCGFPLSKACGDDEGEQQPSSSMFDDEDEFGFGWKAVAVGYGCGFLFGVLMGYLVFSIGKPQWLVKLVEVRPKKMVRNTKSKASRNRGRVN